MVDQKIREHTIKPETLRERRRKKDSNLFLIDFRIKNPIAVRKLILHGDRSFESTWTNWQEKTNHTLPHGRKDRDARKREG